MITDMVYFYKELIYMPRGQGVKLSEEEIQKILDEKTKEVFLKNKEKLDNLEKVVKKGISKEELNTFFEVIEKMKENIKEYRE